MPGQESVWDYPRPPRWEYSKKHIQIFFAGEKVADTTRAIRVLETSHPPVYYLPPEDIQMQLLEDNTATSYCEWKGRASYYNVIVRDQIAELAAWYYPRPESNFQQIQNYVAFYAQKMERCTIDGEIVRPQPGNFYGGWITNDIVGPFKGTPGTMGW